MPNFLLGEWIVLLVILAVIGVVLALLPWAVAEIIKGVKKRL